LIKDFDIPDHLLVAKIKCARMISPADKQVDMHIDNGYVGMVDRQDFDEFLRVRAAQSGAIRQQAIFDKVEHDAEGTLWVQYTPVSGKEHAAIPIAQSMCSLTTRSSKPRWKSNRTMASAVMFTTKAKFHRTFMAGCFRMAKP
jgi:hypothetical protein